jgi:cell division protein DivIC
VGIKSIEMNSRRVSALSETEAELNDEIKQEQARSDELDQYEKYTQTKKYVEDVAKDKLGLSS